MTGHSPRNPVNPRRKEHIGPAETLRLRHAQARIRGRLYEGPGFPVLEVPDEDILACGTSDPLADVATQVRLSARVGSISPTRPRKHHSGRLGRRVRGTPHLR